MPRPAMIAAGRGRLILGQDLRLMETGRGHIWLEGSARLRPGQALDLVGEWPGLGDLSGHARVMTWRIVRITDAGPHYRGCCRIEP